LIVASCYLQPVAQYFSTVNVVLHKMIFMVETSPLSPDNPDPASGKQSYADKVSLPVYSQNLIHWSPG